jgi:predicted HTH domain antitoxin
LITFANSVNYYARLYGDGKRTLARAACDAGVSLWEMMDYVRSKKILAQYDFEDFQKDFKRIYGRMASR